MCWSDHARRFALSCVLASISIAVAAPSAAQGLLQTDGVIASAAREAATMGIEWLGPHPGADPDLTVRRPLWQGPGAMFVEQQVAQRAIRSRWPGGVDAGANAILDGFARYLQARAIENQFDRRYLRKTHHVETREYFGGQVIWSFPPLRISRDAAIARDRHAAVFSALERWIGEPALQGAMVQVAHVPPDRLTGDEIVRTISRAAGQDLSWIFTAAAGADINYSIATMTSQQASSCGSPCVDTSITVERSGEGVFSGRSAPPSGDFNSGDALRLKVRFADGSDASVWWDGRARSRTFQFRGPSPAVAAYLDPDRIVTLDRNYLDNSAVTPVPTNVPVRKWAARWVVWLQHTMLSYGFLA